MSQSGAATAGGSGAGFIETLTGNSGGAVGPDASFNINILGNNSSGINIVGVPASNTLTVVGLQSSETQRGTVELATAAETTTGTSTTLAVHPSGLNTKLGTQTLNALIYGGGGAGSNLGVLSAATNGQLPIGNTGSAPTIAALTAGAGITITNGAGSITIAATGLDLLTYTEVTFAMSPYTVLSTDEYLGVDCIAGAVTIRLPDTPSTGRVIYIKDKQGQAAVNAITVTTVSGVRTIDSALSQTMNTAFRAIQVIFNGSNYEVF